MNCQTTQTLLHGYMDDELDLVSTLAIERHLQSCAACTQVYHSHQALRSALWAGSLYHKAPVDLRKRVQASLPQARPARRAWHLPALRWTGALAALALIILFTWSLARGPFASSAEGSIAQEAISSHVRSLMADHLADVASSNQHTVKPWFDGKLDFSPPVVDLTRQGFPLIGGRLDYLDQRPVAALIYQRRLHTINLFIWPSPPGADHGAQTLTSQGYHVVHWTQAGMTYWAVSDLEEGDLQAFVQLVQSQTPPATAPS